MKVKQFTFLMALVTICQLSNATHRTKIDISDVIPDINSSMSVTDIYKKYTAKLVTLGIEWSTIDTCWYLVEKSTNPANRGHMTANMAQKIAYITRTHEKAHAYYELWCECQDVTANLLALEKDTIKAKKWLIKCAELSWNREMFANFLLNIDMYGYGGYTLTELQEAFKIIDDANDVSQHYDFYQEVLSEIRLIQQYKNDPDNIRESDFFKKAKDNPLECYYLFIKGDCQYPNDKEFFNIVKPYFDGNHTYITGFKYQFSASSNGTKLLFAWPNDSAGQKICEILTPQIKQITPDTIILKHTGYHIPILSTLVDYEYEVILHDARVGYILGLEYSKKNGWYYSAANVFFNASSSAFFYADYKNEFKYKIHNNKEIQSIDPQKYKNVYINLHLSSCILRNRKEVGRVDSVLWVDINKKETESIVNLKNK